MTLAEAGQQLKEHMASWEYTFAYGHGCGIGQHPSFWLTRARHEELLEQLNAPYGLREEK